MDIVPPLVIGAPVDEIRVPRQAVSVRPPSPTPPGNTQRKGFKALGRALSSATYGAPVARSRPARGSGPKGGHAWHTLGPTHEQRADTKCPEGGKQLPFRFESNAGPEELRSRYG